MDFGSQVQGIAVKHTMHLQMASKLLYLRDLGIQKAGSSVPCVIDSQAVKYRNSYQNHLAGFSGSYGAIVAASMLMIALSVSTVSAQDSGEAESALLPETVSPSDQHSYVTDEYRIGVADVLGISVWREPDHSIASVIVRPDGKISVPLLREIESASP